MPKISKQNFRYGGKTLELEIWYKNETFYFKTGFPNEIRVFGEFDNINRTESGLINEFKGAIAKTEKALEETDLVLIVKFKVTDNMSMTWTPHADGGRSGVPNGLFPSKFMPDFNSRSSFYGYGFLIDWSVMYRTTSPSKQRFSTANEQPDGSFTPGHHTEPDLKGRIVMPYTKERKDFFQGMADATTKLALQISNFLGGDDAELIGKIDAAMSPNAITAGDIEEKRKRLTEVSAVIDTALDITKGFI